MGDYVSAEVAQKRGQKDHSMSIISPCILHHTGAFSCYSEYVSCICTREWFVLVLHYYRHVVVVPVLVFRG